MATVVVVLFSLERQNFFFERQGEDWKGSLISVGWFFLFVFFIVFLQWCVSLTQSNYDDKLSSGQKLAANLTTLCKIVLKSNFFLVEAPLIRYYSNNNWLGFSDTYTLKLSHAFIFLQNFRRIFCTIQ